MHSAMLLGNNKALPDQQVEEFNRLVLGTLSLQVLGHQSEKICRLKV